MGGQGLQPQGLGGSENLGASTTESETIESVDISNFANTGDAFLFFKKDPAADEPIYVVNQSGSLVAGGPDDIGVSDGTDFAEVFAYVLNDLSNSRPSLRVGNASTGGVTRYKCRSTETLTKSFTLWGPGKNRVLVTHSDAVSGSDIFTMNPDAGESAILRIDSMKFDGRFATSGGEPDRWFLWPDQNEVLLTDTEFRNCGVAGFDATGTNSFNYVSNCWFIDGASLVLEDLPDIRLMGNKFKDANLDLTNCSRVIRRGNEFRGTAASNLSGVSFSRPDEEFGNIEIGNESGITDARVPPWMPIVEDFEEGDLSYYTGDTGVYSIQTGTVLVGSNAVQLDADSQGTLRSPFKMYRGMSASVAVYNESGSRQHLALATDPDTTMIGAGDGYDFRVVPSNNAYQLFRYDSGAGTLLASDDTGAVPTGEWLIVRVDIDHEDITTTLSQLDGTEIYSITTDDANHGSDGLYFQLISATGTGENNYWDMMTRKPL